MSELTPNKTWLFKKPPTTLPMPGINTAIEDRPLRLISPPGGLVMRLLIAGFDPHQRDRMREPSALDYVPCYEIDEPISSFSIGQVIRSNHERFVEGSLIAGLLPISQYGVIPGEMIDIGDAAAPILWRVTNDYNLDLKHYVGTLGLAGMTAWNSFYGLVKPVSGETIWINAASSSVGQLVVQLAKIEGMRVIASVSSDDKLDYVLNELGADVGFNYRQEPIQDALKRLAPDGLDVVFDNIGGDHFQAAIENMKWFGRIICCGMASQYNQPVNKSYGVTNLGEIVRRRIKIQGFVYSDENIFGNVDNFWKTVPRWISEGKIKSRYTEFEGIKNVDQAFISMFTGGSFGKTIVRINDLKDLAKAIAAGLTSNYSNAPTKPEEWWQISLMYTALIDYWALTGDDQYNAMTKQNIVGQIASKSDFMSANQTSYKTNSEQASWALAAMNAAEAGLDSS
ncbi:uncharacterized protein TRUGW13939_00068 [Talaromyces rugulosus]|uniref:Enoyl reductase (ER) domain-containing protein n=1 Tax=Talaromyces rugulosus TaxID=121627 RepID=A0A7H8QGD1_TALRU|nr:uncharacterized protein TRUGW13939_00068 [Talaromyces rugulosus]QKX52997.1 hypothetical protein TRUGW13939_00068 [Talaromyces rugulosus]